MWLHALHGVRWTVNGISAAGGRRRQYPGKIRISGTHFRTPPTQGFCFVLDFRFVRIWGMGNSVLLVLWGVLLVWFVFEGDAISTLSITGNKFYDATGQQVFFKGIPHRLECQLISRSRISAVAAGSIGEYHAMPTRCAINANSRRKCHPM